jgi:hypothetical protein
VWERVQKETGRYGQYPCARFRKSRFDRAILAVVQGLANLEKD